jgi:hypothetical protein
LSDGAVIEDRRLLGVHDKPPALGTPRSLAASGGQLATEPPR